MGRSLAIAARPDDAQCSLHFYVAHPLFALLTRSALK